MQVKKQQLELDMEKLTGSTYIHTHPGGSDSEESACNVGDLGSIPGSERSPGEENGYPLQ